MHEENCRQTCRTILIRGKISVDDPGSAAMVVDVPEVASVRSDIHKHPDDLDEESAFEGYPATAHEIADSP